MINNTKLLLMAEERNWGLMGPGDWSEVKWRIFRDGSYEVISKFNPTFEDYEKASDGREHPKADRKKITGKMEDADFTKLRAAIKCVPWRDPSIDVDAFDGVAWKIESYKEDGIVENTSGKLDYIYGHSVLETIVSLLPDDSGNYYSSAFVSIDRKTE